jgi:hypothetical protein
MKRVLSLFTLIALTFTLAACSGVSKSSNPGGGGQGQAQVFVTGEDAPLPSVVSFNITINKITLNNSSTTATALSTPVTVDFVRLLGLRSLLGFNTVAPGTYTSATFTLANPQINYVNLSANPPTIAQVPNPSLTNSTVTVSFPNSAPLVVGANGLAGLHMDFDLRKSLQQSGGQLTGVVNPTIFVSAVQASDDAGQITDLLGSVVSVNTSTNSFVMQGPYGFQYTIDVNPSSTTFNTGWSISNLAAPAIVATEGTMQANGSILASAVEVISTNKAFLSGRILAVNPGPVVTMFVGEELPAMSGTPVDSVQTIDLSQVPSNSYAVCFLENPVTQALFNANAMVVGQRILIGGDFDSSNNTFTNPQFVSLRRQGVVGDLVSNSVNVVSGNQGSFQLQNNFLLGYALGGPLTVETGNGTKFININGLAGLQSAGATNLVVRGLVLDNPNNPGVPIMWAGRVRVLP